MDKLIKRYWLPSLIIALFIAMFFDFRSVEKLTLDSGYSKPTVNARQQGQAVSETRSRLAAGQSYTSLEELVNDQRIAGFVRTGTFGNHWPATVAEVATESDGISFVRQNGTRHSYTKFSGYKMKMVRLRADDKETIVVFRSQHKR